MNNFEDQSEGHLTIVEIAAAVLVVCVLTACFTRLVPARTLPIFGGQSPFFRISLSLGSSYAGFLAFLIPLRLSPSVRAGGALLGATVTTSIFYVLLFLDQSPGLSFLILWMGGANAVRSRCQIKRFPALVAAFFSCVSVAFVHWFVKP